MDKFEHDKCVLIKTENGWLVKSETPITFLYNEIALQSGIVWNELNVVPVGEIPWNTERGADPNTLRPYHRERVSLCVTQLFMPSASFECHIFVIIIVIFR